MVRRSGIGVAVGVLSLLALLAGCASAVPKSNDIVGAYASQDNAQMVLSADGRCKLENMPVWALSEGNGQRPSGGTGERVSAGANCTWAIGAGDQLRSNDGVPLVSLSFGKDSPLSVIGLTFRVDGSARALYFYIGDPDSGERYTFARSK
jgi:hypothetical protein